MSFLVQQFNNLNLPNYLPGMVLDSGAMSTTAIYNLPAANYATVSIPSANIYVAGSTQFSIYQQLTGDNLYGVVTQNITALDPSQTVEQLAQAFNPSYNVSYNAGQFIITSKFPGLLGQFTVTNSLGSTPSSAPPDALPILAGRIVVPDGTNFDPLKPYQSTYVSYPTTTNATIDSLGGLFVTGIGDLVSYTPYPYNNNSDSNSYVRPLNRVQIYTQANGFVMQAITPLSTVTPLFVETSIANFGVNTGKLTATASATTVALPVSRLRIVQGTATAGGLVIAQLI